MPNRAGVVCQAEFPMKINGNAFALCTRAPGHRGDHKCRIHYTWLAGGEIIEKGTTLMTGRYMGSREKPFIWMSQELTDPPNVR